MSNGAVSPLRWHRIEDMTIRNCIEGPSWATNDF